MCDYKDKISIAVQDGLRAVDQLLKEENLDFIERCAHMISECFKKGGKIIIAGNGGSLCDAMHFAEELSGQYREARPALPAMALSDAALMSCTANDYSYEKVFSRGVEAFGRPEDIFIGLTTSGNSPNIIEAVKTAKRMNMQTIAFLGKTGGLLKGMCDLELMIEGFYYSDRIQEAHMTAIHIIIEIIEEIMMPIFKQSEEIEVCQVN